MSKFNDIFKIGSTIGKQFLPPVGGSILDVVGQSIEDKNDVGNAKGMEALAKELDDTQQAVLILDARLKKAGF